MVGSLQEIKHVSVSCLCLPDNAETSMHHANKIFENPLPCVISLARKTEGKILDTRKINGR